VAPSLYLGKKIVEILKTEVITPAKQKGYEVIYLVGTSLGGHGALLYATEYPEDVDAVALFSPFVTGYPPIDLVEEPGGSNNGMKSVLSPSGLTLAIFGKP
jgi:pimeloyl-ACP methyl ester carboxylesterase